MFAGGNQSGKTLGGIIDDLIQCCDEDSLPEHLRPYKFWTPPFKCRVVTPSFGHTLAQFQEKLKEQCPLSQLKGGSWDSAYSRQDYTLHFENGSYIQFLSGDQEVSKHAGATLDRVHFDEEPPGEHGRLLFIENSQRVAIRKGQLMFTMTPDKGVTWTGDMIWEKRGEPGYFGIQVDMDDNPYYPEDQKEIRLANLTEEERKARKSGEFVYLKGKVYPEFNENHVVDPPHAKHVRKLDNIVCIDPGLTKMAVTWTGFDSDNVALVYDELYLDNVDVETTSQLIKEKNASWGLTEPMYVIDPTSQNRNATNMTGIDQAFFLHDIYPIYGQNDVDPGIFQIKRRLQSNGISFSNQCENLIWELQRYRYHEQDTPMGKKVVPVKKDDHLVDSIRYACMERFWGEAPKIKKRRKQSTVDYQMPYKEEPQHQEFSPMGPLA
jgi:phage terminase large subunit-like protein